MRQKSKTTKVTSEQVVKDICRATRKQYSAEKKIRIVLVADSVQYELIPDTKRRGFSFQGLTLGISRTGARLIASPRQMAPNGRTAMALEVIGLGVGRTGTYSLKLALQALGFGPCHHMDAVIADKPRHVPYWAAALAGRPDWPDAYAGFRSAVDWPTAAFTKELYAEHPDARYVLTVRSPENWAESFSETIYKALQGRRNAPPEAQPWLEMVADVVAKTGFPPGLDNEGLKAAFNAHTELVRRTIPANQLLVYQVKEDWEPLCKFLDCRVPNEPFPRTNNREEFWERVTGKKSGH